MFRSSPRRGQRSKGLKVKHCIQLTLLLGVVIWLLYQVRHSEKKSQFEESEAKVVGEKVVKLGRKDLNPLVEETEDEASRNVESFNGKDSGLKNMDDNGDGKNDEIVDGDEDSKEIESKETGKEDSNNEESEIEEKKDNVGTEEKQGSEEARENNYKGDDASSKVVHEADEKTGEVKNGEKMEMEEESRSNRTDDVSFQEDKSGPKTEEVEDSVIKSVLSNTTDNGERSSDVGNTGSSEGESMEKEFSDSNGDLPESNKSTSNATETTEKTDDSKSSTEKSTGSAEWKFSRESRIF